MAKAKYKLQLDDHLLSVTLSGVFNVSDVVAYENVLKQTIAPLEGNDFIMLSDIERLEPSPLDAVERVQEVTDFLFEHGCNYIINIHPDNQPIVDYQIKLAAGKHQVLMVNSMAAGRALLAEIKENNR